jgi:hypothetical protein
MNHLISLGAGVQSSTMALMAAKGLIEPMPIAAIFADTMAEPSSVYTWLDWLETQLPFPVIRVSAGDLAKEALKLKTKEDGTVHARVNIPLHARNPDGSAGRIMHRNCTVEYKIRPIQKEVRRLVGVKRGSKDVQAIQWIGISLDEVTRMKESNVPFIKHRWPLVEMGMRRSDCLVWMEDNHFPMPPRSSCVFCPFHNNNEWRRLKLEEPEEFAKAVAFEKHLQTANTSDNFKSTVYCHSSLKPLDEVDFSNAEDRGQLNLFENECEGMCGV